MRAALIFSFLFASAALADQEAPHFDSDSLALTRSRATIDIAGTIARVEIEQRWATEGDEPIEAVYRFSSSENAAISGLTMTIGERTIVAKLQERQQARETYEEAKEEGKIASLLEMERPNVLKMNVAKPLPALLRN